METLRQYEQSQRAAAISDYGVTGREYDAAYPAGSHTDQWIENTRLLAREGAALTRHIERSIRDNCSDAERIIHHLRLDAEGACAECERIGNGSGPRHDASPHCESGGRNHCTCGICF